MSSGVPHTLNVGRYRLLRELGQGGTATVFAAVASGPAGFNKLVVLKSMKPQLAREPGFAEMFLSEARLAARLNHPNIVQTNEVFEHDGLPVIVMEYLEGKSLADLTAARGEDTPNALGHDLFIISEALSGLHYSHELLDYDGKPLGLVHRDMTPHNVFVTYEGQVKILDFGIAKLSDTTLETETGVVKGKLRYISPEQIVAERVDRRADIYSVGVMLWEAAVGEKMWRGLSDATVMNRVVNEEIPRPSQHNPKVEPRLEALVMKALAADPHARHQTAKELQEELDALRKAFGDLPTARDLAPVLKRMFDVDRTQTKKEIDQRISVSPPPPERSVPPGGFAPPAAEPSTRSLGWKRRIGYAGIGALALTLGVTLRWRTEPEAVVTSSPNVAPEPFTRLVRFTAFPREAEIVVDGALAPDNPHQYSAPPDDREHVVVARAAGYQTVTQHFRLDRDVDAVFRLQFLESPKSVGSVVVESLPNPVNAAAPPSPAKPAPPLSPALGSAGGSAMGSVGGASLRAECDPPYVMDGRGVKRFKVECMP